MSQVERQRFGHECIYYGNQAGLYLEVVGEQTPTSIRSTLLEIVDFSRNDFENKKRYRLSSYELRKIAKMLDEAADKVDGMEDDSENSVPQEDDSKNSVSQKESDLSFWDRW